MEDWQDITDFKCLYQVSTLGNVRRVLRDKRSPSHKLLNPSKNSKGYLRVQLCKEGKAKWFFVHRLVAEAFILNSSDLLCVNHIDGNKLNNAVTNLEFISHQDNITHARDVLKVDFNRNHEKKISEEKLNEVKILLDKGLALRQIQAQSGVDRATIRRHFPLETKLRTENPYEYRRKRMDLP